MSGPPPVQEPSPPPPNPEESGPGEAAPARTPLPAHWALPLRASLFALSLLVLVGIIVKLCGADPGAAYRQLFLGAVGSAQALGETLSRTLVLGLSGLAVALSFRAGLFNIGAEGQFLAGAAAGAAGGLLLLPKGVPAGLGIPALLGLGALAGAGWSVLAGLLRQFRGVSEVISTLLLNLVAVWLVKLLVNAPDLLRDPQTTFAKSAPLPAGSQLLAWGGTGFHSGLFLLLPAAAGLQFLLAHTHFGLRIRATGFNRQAAQACGIPVGPVLLFVFACSGALAGLGGASAVMAAGYLPEELFVDYGYVAIAVALVASLHPLWVLPSAFFFAALETGAKAMERHAGVPSQLVLLIEGLVILALLARGLRLPGTQVAGEGT